MASIMTFSELSKAKAEGKKFRIRHSNGDITNASMIVYNIKKNKLESFVTENKILIDLQHDDKIEIRD